MDGLTNIRHLWDLWIRRNSKPAPPIFPDLNQSLIRTSLETQSTNRTSMHSWRTKAPTGCSFTIKRTTNSSNLVTSRTSEAEKSFTLQMVSPFSNPLRIDHLISYSIGETKKLKGKGIFFLRTVPSDKTINLNVASDNDILFGEISEHTIHSLNTIINAFYKPLVG